MEQEDPCDYYYHNDSDCDHSSLYTILVRISFLGFIEVCKPFGFCVTCAQLLPVHPSNIQNIQAPRSGSLEHHSDANADTGYY